MNRPKLLIVAGPNGAGKTTCVQREPIVQLVQGYTFLNPDNLTKDKLQALGFQGFVDAPVEQQTSLFIESANEVQLRLEQAVERNEAIGVETVLSSEKYCPLIERVIALGGTFRLIYVALQSPKLAMTRVAARVASGGHGIPDDKIEARYSRSLDLLPWFARRASAFWVVDNSDSNREIPPTLIVHGAWGRVEFLSPDTFPAMKAALTPLL